MKREEKIKSRIYREALEVALDTRKFEIGLYWQRTRYFFDAFLALGGFSLILALLGLCDKVEQDFIYALLITVECVGIVAAFAWICANRGSKYWQVNWEQYVDALGENFIGPLFQHPIDPKKNKKKRYSVSNVNLTLSRYIFGVWIAILVLTIVAWCFSSDCSLCKEWSKTCLLLIFSGVVVIGSVIAICRLGCCCIGGKDQGQGGKDQVKKENDDNCTAIDNYRKTVKEIANKLFKAQRQTTKL